jgi:hypothetical protein
MARSPTDNVLVEKVALPPERVTAGWATPSTLNVTVPVAVLGNTVATKVTDWPDVDGFCCEETVVVVEI